MYLENVHAPLAAVFHDRSLAQQTVLRLQSEGLPPDTISLLSLRTLRPDSFLRLSIPRSDESRIYAAIEAGALVLVVAPPPEARTRVAELLFATHAAPEAAPSPTQHITQHDVDLPFQPGIFEHSQAGLQSRLVEEISLRRPPRSRVKQSSSACRPALATA